MIRHGRRTELEPIVVAERYRGRGVGRALVERVAAEARAGQSLGVFVRPTARNASALAFFRSAGFDVLTYVRLELDFEPRDRSLGASLAGLEFRM
jgi:GNAT superfamily N-acetyltransferase